LVFFLFSFLFLLLFFLFVFVLCCLQFVSSSPLSFILLLSLHFASFSQLHTSHLSTPIDSQRLLSIISRS
jgi:hypothetical protein